MAHSTHTPHKMMCPGWPDESGTPSTHHDSPREIIDVRAMSQSFNGTMMPPGSESQSLRQCRDSQHLYATRGDVADMIV